MPSLCPLAALEPGRPAIIGASDDRLQGGLILLRLEDDRILAYRNACPHMGIPLDWEPSRLLSANGRHLRCTGHGALFRMTDGYCTRGPCEGEALHPVPVRLEDGMVIADG